MRDRRWLWKPLALAVIFFIHGCSSSDETEPANETLAGEEEYDLSISGSVGDGPAANAMIRVMSKTGELLATSIGDSQAGYDIELKTKGKHYPITIEASGGVDLISGSPLDFLLTSTVPAPRNKAIAHINPYTTLAIAIARQTSAGMTSQTIASAVDSVVEEFNLGMTSAISLDPLTAPIDDSNLAEIIKSAEGLAEIFRRVAAAATRAGFSATIDTVIDAIAADLVDGMLDGSGAVGTNRRLSAITLLVKAQVATELIRNELRVNGQIATATLDDIIRVLASGQAPALTESRPVNAHLIRSVLDGIDAASALGNAGSLDAMRDDFANLQSGTTAEAARLTVPSTTTSAFSGPVGEVAAGSEAEFSLVLATSTDEPPDNNSPPTISGTPSTSVVAGFPYAFTPTASDVDGDALSFSIVNRPAWATFSTQTGSLNGTPLSGDVGTYANIQISVSDGQASTSLPTFSIDVEATAPPPPPPPPPPNSVPTISGVPATSVVQDAAYGFTPTASDADGDTLTFSIQNRPVWAGFSTATGTLSGTPTAAQVGTHPNIVISVSDGSSSASLPAFAIEVTAAPPPPNTPPTISGSPAPSVEEGNFYSFTPSASDDDGDTLTFAIQNRPSWTLFNGVTGQLSGTPGAANVGTHSNVRISVSDGQDTVSLPAFSIDVTAAPPPPNTPPTISGNPATAVEEGSPYSFTPSANDDDGDTLTFAIQNRPSWASFSASTGRLNGTPGSTDVGTYSNIRITVSDGQDSASLPTFSLTVSAAPPPPNTPPTIGGSPVSSVLQDTPYSFTPTAGDADGDTLTFTIQNQPSWASFSSSTGQLSGVPGAGDVGTYANISISVSDGQNSVSLPAFSISVDAVALGTATLSWEAPTTNVDGSPLDDLAGYEIAWGGASGNYPNSVTVMNPGITSYVVENLANGTHFFAVKAINSGGLRSDFSNEASKTIP